MKTHFTPPTHRTSGLEFILSGLPFNPLSCLPIFVLKNFTNLKGAKTVHDKVDVPLKGGSSVIDSINGGNKNGPKSVARAQIARRSTSHIPAKRSIAVVIDDTDDAENRRLIKRQIMMEFNMLVDSDIESEERVDLPRRFRDRSPANLPAQKTQIRKPVTPYFSARPQVSSYSNDPSGATTTNDESESSATPLPRQPRPQAQPHEESYESSDNEDANEDEINDETDDGNVDPQLQFQFHRKPSQLGYSPPFLAGYQPTED